MITAQTWIQLGLALALGLFVGLERERSGHTTGIRTFPLITLFGAAVALVADPSTEWMIPAGLVVLALALAVTSDDASEDEDERGHGATTIVAAFVMYTVGAMLVLEYASVAVALGGSTAVLLHWKEPLHRFVDRLGADETGALYRFVLIAVVVLPVLPDRAFGPYDVFNPFRIWLIVVLIVGISVAGYLVYKFVSARAGVVIGGVLGGIVSSTAATVAYSRRAKAAPAASPASAAAIMIASTLSFVRIVVEVAVVAPNLVGVVLPKFGVLVGIMAVASVGAYLTMGREGQEASQPEEPAALRIAVVFGGLYAVILFAVAVAEQHFGRSGMYVVATLSGLTDVDAITLSTAEMIRQGRVASEVGWRMMLIGGLANMVFKGGIVALLGHRRLLGRIAILFGATVVGGLGILWLWPTA